MLRSTTHAGLVLCATQEMTAACELTAEPTDWSYHTAVRRACCASSRDHSSISRAVPHHCTSPRSRRGPSSADVQYDIHSGTFGRHRPETQLPLHLGVDGGVCLVPPKPRDAPTSQARSSNADSPRLSRLPKVLVAFAPLTSLGKLGPGKPATLVRVLLPLSTRSISSKAQLL